MTATTGELHAYLAADTTPVPRKHVYGAGCWCRPIRDEVGALVHGDVDVEAEGTRHLDTVRSLVASAKATAPARDHHRPRNPSAPRCVRLVHDQGRAPQQSRDGADAVPHEHPPRGQASLVERDVPALPAQGEGVLGQVLHAEPRARVRGILRPDGLEVQVLPGRLRRAVEPVRGRLTLGVKVARRPDPDPAQAALPLLGTRGQTRPASWNSPLPMNELPARGAEATVGTGRDDAVSGASAPPHPARASTHATPATPCSLMPGIVTTRLPVPWRHAWRTAPDPARLRPRL